MKPAEVLSSHKLKRTSCREGIIDVILSAGNPLSENEIRERLHGSYDRSTFYRSFRTLEEHNVIHSILIENQVIKYALTGSASPKGDHAHFYCRECHTVKCLEPLPAVMPTLPEGFSGDETMILVKGVCSICRKPELN